VAMAVKLPNHICPVCKLSKFEPGKVGMVAHPKCSKILQSKTKDIKRKKPKSFGNSAVEYFSKTQ
jgi:uncharacterized Zn finger protein (UPF0148 family)